MPKRLLTLAGLVVLVGFATRVFAEDATVQRPETMTRAGAVALMVESDRSLATRLEHFIEHRPPMPLFSDLDYEDWYAPYIETAFEAGIIGGSDDGLFHPSQLMREEEMIALAVRYHAQKNTILWEEISTSSGE